MIRLFKKRLELDFSRLPRCENEHWYKLYKMWIYIVNNEDTFCGRFFNFTFYYNKKEFDMDRFEIATLTDDDLKDYNLENLDYATKQEIAQKLGDAYMNHMFDDSLKAVLEEMNLI